MELKKYYKFFLYHYIKKMLTNNSKKIINFFDKKYINYEHNVLDLIRKIIKKIDIKFSIISKTEYNHYNNNIPLIQQLCIELVKNNIMYSDKLDTFTNSHKFTKWIRFNDLPNILEIRTTNQSVNNILSTMLKDDIRKIIYTNIFISVDVQYHFETSDLILYVISSEHLKLYLYVLKNSNIDINKIIHAVKIIQSLYKYYNKKEPFDLNLYIFAGKQKKEITYEDKILTYENVNSGVTTENYIFIWRLEELIKVLIHELIHYYNFDCRTLDDLDEFIKQTFNIVGDDSINESYTEMLALIINSLFIEFYTSYTFSFMISIEQKFTLFQIAKILTFYNMSKFDDISEHGNYITQRTNVFSYFFIKGILLMSLEDFLNFIQESIVFGKKQNEYKNLIIKSIKKFPIKYVNNLIRTIKNDDTFIFKTLRMTAFELNIS